MIVALKTKAYAAMAVKQPLRPFEVTRREPGVHDVLIDIKYCGICHSDLHQSRDEWGGSIFPMVPGHEIVGIVSRIGTSVSKYKVGDRVGVGCMIDSCRECDACREGLEQYCVNSPNWTYNSYEKDGKTPTYGGYSTIIVVDENYVVRIPEGLPMESTAPLLCAGITTYSPLAHWGAGPGKSVAVVGLGGLGHMAVKIASAMGAHVTVLSRSLAKAADGSRLGAEDFYATADAETFKKLAGKFDLIIDTVSADHDLNLHIGLLKRDGAMVLVGVPPESARLRAGSLISGRRTLAGSVIGGIAETQEMLDFCASKNVVADIELIPIEQVNEAYERMLTGDVRYRFVIDCASLA